MYLTGIKTYFRLQRNLRRSLGELKAEQWKNFCELVNFAYTNVPFYRNLYDQADFKPSDLKSPDDLGRVPKTRKALYQQADPESLISRGYSIDKLLRRRTSGSSGSPLNVYYTPADRIYRTILHLRILFYNGMRFRDRMHLRGRSGCRTIGSIGEDQSRSNLRLCLQHGVALIGSGKAGA